MRKITALWRVLIGLLAQALVDSGLGGTLGKWLVPHFCVARRRHDLHGLLRVQLHRPDQNWSGISAAPAANNSDKDIRTSFYNIGLMYLFNQDWGVMVNIPYWDRSFTTTTDAAGDIGNLRSRGTGRHEGHGLIHRFF